MEQEQLKQRSETLKRKILVNMIFLPLIPFLAVTGVSFYFFANAMETGTREKLLRVLSDHSRMIESFLAERRADLEIMVQIYPFEALEADGAIDRVFSLLERRSHAFVDLGLFDAQGNHLRYCGPYALVGKPYAEEEWFRKTMDAGYYISDIFLGYRNSPHFVVAVRRQEGARTWVLRATIDTLFFDTLVSSVRMGRTGEAYLLNHRGVAQTARRSGDIKLLAQDPAFGWFETVAKAGGVCISPKGQPFLYGVTRLHGKAWILVVRQEKSDAYKALYSAGSIGLVITICGLALLGMTAMFTSERIIRRIHALDQEKGDLGSQLIRAVQLAEMGEMAAGFAHEINNPLQVIKSEYALLKVLLREVFPESGNCQESPEQADRLAEIRESLEQINTQVARCNRITSAILKFGRKSDTKSEPLDPGQLIPEILGLVENTVRVSGVELKVDLDPHAPCFTGDVSRFQQVMLNLINNAVDAVSQRHGVRGGRIEVTAAGSRDSQALEIQVKDNGCGIQPEHMGKLFSPFFTTKAVGRGTGLGLSVCYGIIESFGGTMAVESRPDKGTLFLIRLPAVHCQNNHQTTP